VLTWENALSRVRAELPLLVAVVAQFFLRDGVHRGKFPDAVRVLP